MRVAGLGFRQGATDTAMANALMKAHVLAGNLPISALATHESKSHHPAIQALASTLGLPVLPIDATALSKTQTETQSKRIIAHYGTGSIAEAAALAAAGAGARLLCARVASDDGMAVAAIAEGHEP